VATSTIKAAAFRTGATTSGTTTATYTISGAPPDVAVDGGLVSSMARLPNNELWVFGGNASGQLGDGTNDDSHVPRVLASPTNVTQAEMGGTHTLSVDGNVARAWGYNANGRLGNGGATSSNTAGFLLLPLFVVPAVNMFMGENSIYWWARHHHGHAHGGPCRRGELGPLALQDPERGLPQFLGTAHPTADASEEREQVQHGCKQTQELASPRADVLEHRNRRQCRRGSHRDAHQQGEGPPTQVQLETDPKCKRSQGQGQGVAPGRRAAHHVRQAW